MHLSFREGFEKNAGIGSFVLNTGKKLLSKVTKSFSSAKNVGTSGINAYKAGGTGQVAKSSLLGLGKKLTGNTVDGKWSFAPGKAGLATVGGLFGAAEVADVVNKTKSTSKNMRTVMHRGMNGSAINNVPRHTNMNNGMGQTRYR